MTKVSLRQNTCVGQERRLTVRLSSVAVCISFFLASSVSASGQKDYLEKLSRKADEAMAAKRFAQAAAAFSEIVQMRPHLAEAHSNLALAQYSQGRFVEASQGFRKALNLNPKLHHAHILLGFSYFALAQFEKAIESLQPFSGDSATVDILERLALAYLRTDEPSKALNVLEAWRRKDPSNADVLYHIGQTHTLLAVRSYEALKKVAPSSARLHQLQAEILEQQGHLEPAIAEYRTAISITPGMAGLRYKLGKLLWDNKRSDEAEQELLAELELGSADAATNYLLGNICLQKGSLETARKHLRRAIELAPRHPGAHADLGRLLRMTGDSEGAEKELRHAAELAPDREDIHYSLFDLYRRMGRHDEARRELQIHQTLQKQNQERGRKGSM